MSAIALAMTVSLYRSTCSYSVYYELARCADVHMHVCETNIDAHVKFKELTDKTCMYVHINVHSCSRSKTVACSIGMLVYAF